MYAVEKLSRYISRGVYTVSAPFHPFGGAVDIIVVQQEDGSLKSSPWYVKFGKFQGVLKTTEKVVTICVNGVEAGFHMYLDHKGEAFFLKDCDSEGGGDFEMSPPSSGDELDEKIRSVRFEKAHSCIYDGGHGERILPPENGNLKIVPRSSSRGGIFGLFRTKSVKGDEQGVNVDRLSSLETAEIAADLLESKWSTNMQSNGCSTDNLSGASGFDVTIVDNEHDEELAIKDSLAVAANCIGSDPNPCLNIDKSVKESVVVHDEKLSDCPQANLVREVHFKELITQTSTSSTHEEVLEVFTLETGDMNDRGKLISESGMTEYGEYTTSLKESILDSITDDFQSAHPLADGQKVSTSEAKHDGGKEVSSLTYTDTIEGSTVRLDVSTQTHAVLNHSSGESRPEVTCKNKCEVTSRLESEKTTDREDYVGRQNQNMELSKVEVSSACWDTQAQSPSNGVDSDSSQKPCSPESEFINQDVDFTAKQFPVIDPLPNDLIFNDGQNLGNDIHRDNPCLPCMLEIAQDESRVPLSESLEDEQFQFSDSDSFSVKQINTEAHASMAAETYDSKLLKLEGNTKEHESEDKIHAEGFLSVSESQTSPLAIPKRTAQLGEAEMLTKSLPIFDSQIPDVERFNLLHPLSYSLDYNTSSYEQNLLKKIMPSCIKLESDFVSGVVGDNKASQTAGTAFESENMTRLNACSPNSAVELSLCKHLLADGMGADAASTAFEANKIFEPQGMIAVSQDEMNLSGDLSGTIVPSEGSWRLWPFSLKKSKTISTALLVPEGTTQENMDVTHMGSQSMMGHDDIERARSTKKKVRLLTPTSEELASLNLSEGKNVITFTFSTAMLGQQQVDAKIYLWKWNTQIVISDVDGTITKSDVLGQFMPLVGKDWSQTGVAHLFSAIKENGYQLLFLSARAISQAHLTRQFLFNLKQDGKALPDGPVILSPDGLFPSLIREVIRRAPHEFKIQCLEDIKALFPPECNPFYAGFGNRDTDEFSYLKVGIPLGKIFIINPKGEVAVNRRVDTKSYTSIHALVNGMFPPVSTAEQEDYNSWNYWKMPLPDVDI